MKKVNHKTVFILLLILAISDSIFSQGKKDIKIYSTQMVPEKNSTIRINNNNRNLEIILWEQQSVKVEMAIPDTLADGIDEKNWLEKTGTRINKFMNRVDIVMNGQSLGASINDNRGNSKVGNQSERGFVVSPYSVLYEWSLNNQPGQLTGMQKEGAAVRNMIPVTVYLPASAVVEVVNKYSTVRVRGNINKGYFNLENSVLDATNAVDLRVLAKYSTMNFEIIGSCEAEISNSTFRAGAIDKMDIESTRSTVEYEKGNILYIRSNLDNYYTIEEVEQVEGRLLYSNLRIEKLNKRMDLDGNNYDLKIRQINPDVELIKINNSWADIRLPVRGLMNYAVNFDGKNCAVFAPFEIIPIVKEESLKNENTPLNFDRGSVLLKNSQRPNAPRYFNTKSGNTSGRFTSIQIACQQCTVDFK